MRIIFFIFLLFVTSSFAGDDDIGYNFVAKSVGRGYSTTNTSFGMMTGGLITLSNNPPFANDAYTFNGLTHLACYNNQTIGNFQTNDHFTVNIIFSTTNNAAFKGMYGKYHLTPDQGWFAATFKTGATVVFYFQIQASTTQYLAKYGNVAINDGNLHMGTATYDANAATNGLAIYVDAVRQSEVVDRAGTVTTITSAAPITLGSREVATASERISGQFKLCEVIGETLNAYQVQQRYNELRKYIITQ